MVTQQVTWSPQKENIQGSFLTGVLREFVWSAKAKWMVGAGSSNNWSLYGESLQLTWRVGFESMLGLVEKVSCVIFCLKFGPSFFANLQKNSHSFHNYCREVRESFISADARCRSANGIVENQYVVLQIANKDGIARVAENLPSRRFSTLKPKKRWQNCRRQKGCTHWNWAFRAMMLDHACC